MLIRDSVTVEWDKIKLFHFFRKTFSFIVYYMHLFVGFDLASTHYLCCFHLSFLLGLWEWFRAICILLFVSFFYPFSSWKVISPYNRRFSMVGTKTLISAQPFPLPFLFFLDCEGRQERRRVQPAPSAGTKCLHKRNKPATLPSRRKRWRMGPGESSTTTLYTPGLWVCQYRFPMFSSLSHCHQDPPKQPR